MNIYVNVNADSPATACVRSETITSQVQFPDLVKGNKVVVNLYLVDGVGGFATISGDAAYTPKMGVGPGSGQTYWTQTTSFTPITNGWTAVLDLSTAAVGSAINGLSEMTGLWELEITNPDTQTQTYAQHDVTILNKVN